MRLTEEEKQEVTTEALQLLEKDVQDPMQIIQKKYFPHIFEDEDERMEYWAWYNNFSDLILIEIDEEKTVKNFLKDYTILENTLLQTAALDGSFSFNNIKLFIQKFMEEILITACACESTELLIFLLEKDRGLSNLKRFNGQFILHWAMQFSTDNIIDALLLYGAVSDAEDSEGKNALHYAAMNGDVSIWLKYSGDPRFKRLLKRCDISGEYPHRN